MKFFLDTINFIRYNLLVATKVITLIICSFYISKYQEYEVKMGFFRDILPTRFVSFIDNSFGMGGTTMLMIPATIIILSFLMDHPILKLLSGFMGVFGTFFSVVRGFYKETLGEISNFGFFMVRHIATLEKKREWFDLEVDRYSQELKGNLVEKLAYLRKYFSNHDYITYDNKLASLTTPEEVKAYAITVINKLVAEYESLPQPKRWYNTLGDGFHTVVDFICTPKGIFVTVIILGVGIGLVYYGRNPEDAKKLFQTGAELGKETVQDQVTTQELMTQLTKISETCSENTQKIVSIENSMLAMTVSNETKIAEIKNQIADFLNLFNNVSLKVSQFQNNIQDITGLVQMQKTDDVNIAKELAITQTTISEVLSFAEEISNKLTKFINLFVKNFTDKEQLIDELLKI